MKFNLRSLIGRVATKNDERSTGQRRVVWAMIIFASLAQADLAISPFVMSAVIGRYHVAENVGVLVMSLQMAAFALGAFGCSAGLDRLRLDHLGRIAAVLVLCNQLLSIFAPNLATMAFARTFVGLGQGLGVGLACTYLSQQKAFARLLFVQGIGASVGGMLIPLTVPGAIAIVGQWGVYIPAVAAAAIGLVPASLVLPSIRLAHVDLPLKLDSKKGAPFMNAIMAVIFAAMISAGSNLLWLYSAQLGQHDGLSLLQMSFVNSSCAVVCLLCPFLALWTVKRFGEFWPLLSLCVIMAAFGWMFATTTSAPIFIMSSYGNNVSFVWAAVLIRMTSAAADRSGRTTAAVGGADSAGWVIGPLAAGVVGIYWPGYTGVAVVALMTFAVACLAVWSRRQIASHTPAELGLPPLKATQADLDEHAKIEAVQAVQG